MQWAKDFFRAVDYLETRPEIDMQKLAYYSLSMGAYFGPIPVALDPRIKVAVFAAGGLRFNYPPETQPANFMPRVKVPVLLVNGKDDFQAPPRSTGSRAARHAAEHKRTSRSRVATCRMTYAHDPEVLDWFDKDLGPVR